MAKAQRKTNAMRLLDQRGVPYHAHWYDPEIRSAADVAGALSLPSCVVFKTLVMQSDSGTPLLVMVPGDVEVDTRRLAAAIGRKSVRMAPKWDAERLTGLQTGGIGALALLDKVFDTYIDSRAMALPFVLVNGGRRGLNLRLSPQAVVELTNAKIVDLT